MYMQLDKSAIMNQVSNISTPFRGRESSIN